MRLRRLTLGEDGDVRGTGRTSAMLQEVLAFANTGKSVLVVVVDHRHADYLRKRIENTPNVAFATMDDMPRGQRYNRVVADHFVYEVLMNEFDARLDALELPR